MVFSSFEFLYVFLPVVLLAYYLCPVRGRNWVALAASLFFYAWGAPRFVLVLVAGCAVDFWLAHFLAPERGHPRRRGIMAVALGLNLITLGYCKYINFAVDSLDVLLEAFGWGHVSWPAVVLPIGISFFTFQRMSYLVDVYRGAARPAQDLHSYTLYVCMFPQLIAGPIVRYHDIAMQLRSRRYEPERMVDGVWRVGIGLAKKVLIADSLAAVAEVAFGLPGGELAPSLAWIGILCYALQIYFDFSGYSDMAIGLGKLLGFDFLENFNRPYIARNFTEFWHRWHISLSNWMRDYLYIPLGGNRKGRARTYLNLWIVFLLSGLWHGAAWNFVLWGAFHGSFLCLDRAIGLERLKRIPGWVSVPVTFLLVCIGWVLFRAESLSGAMSYLGAMADWGRSVSWPEPWQELLSRETRTVLLVAVVSCFAPALARKRFDVWFAQGFVPGPGLRLVRFVTALLLIFLSTLALTVSNFHPFIYFRF